MTKLASVLARAKMIRADIGHPSCVPGAELAVRLEEALDALEEAEGLLEDALGKMRNHDTAPREAGEFPGCGHEFPMICDKISKGLGL